MQPIRLLRLQIGRTGLLITVLICDRHIVTMYLKPKTQVLICLRSICITHERTRFLIPTNKKVGGISDFALLLQLPFMCPMLNRQVLPSPVSLELLCDCISKCSLLPDGGYCSQRSQCFEWSWPRVPSLSRRLSNVKRVLVLAGDYRRGNGSGLMTGCLCGYGPGRT